MHAPPSPPDRTLAGIGLMLFGMFAFSLNDVMGKWLVATFSVAQLLLIRSIAGLAMLAPAIAQAGPMALARPARPWLHVARAVCFTGEVALFYWAVVYLPLADTVAFYLATPILVTVLAVFMLDEKVGWRRWLAVLFGFAGVVVAVNPTGGGDAFPAAIALVGMALFAMANVLTRQLAGAGQLTLVTWQTVAALLFGLVAAPFVWVQPSLLELTALLLLGVVATIGHMAVNRSLAFAPAAVVVPYQYTMIVWAMLLGYLFFGDVPKSNVVIGSAIIVAAGLYIFVREQIRAREKASEGVKGEGI